jgi:hypothetical protein
LILVPVMAVAINVPAKSVTLPRQPAAFVIVYRTITISAVGASIYAIPLTLQTPEFLRRQPSLPPVPDRVAILNINPVLLRPSAMVTAALGAGSHRKQPKTENDGHGRQSQFPK